MCEGSIFLFTFRLFLRHTHKKKQMEETEFEHIAQEMRPRLTATLSTLSLGRNPCRRSRRHRAGNPGEALEDARQALGIPEHRGLRHDDSQESLHRPSETQQSPDDIAGTDETSRRNLYGCRAYRPGHHRQGYAKATQQGDGQASGYAEKNAAIEKRWKEPR